MSDCTWMAAGYFAGAVPRVFGHRGAAGLAPENTIPSFALALALGADMLEFDVHASRDGVIVVTHDPTLERTTNGSGPVREHVWYDLQQLDAGYWFTRGGGEYPFRGHGVRLASLEAVLRAFPLAYCNIEIKSDDPGCVEVVVDVVRQLNSENRVLLAAERDETMEHIRRHANGMATGFAAGEVAEFVSRVQNGTTAQYSPAGRALQIPPRFGDIELVTPAAVAAAHALGLEMHVWTINDPEEIDRLLALHVDGIMSDLPGVARVRVDAYRTLAGSTTPPPR